jgi:diacylglycerol kinase (ATP)
MARRALLLINPNARQGGDFDQELATRLEAEGLEVVSDCGKDESMSAAIVRHRHDVDLVIIGGGDGTLNQAIPALMETRLPLGILPLGTANDLARTLEIPFELATACDAVATGQVTEIDVGEANGKYFFNVASLGLSVDITRRLDPEQKKKWGVLAYLYTAFVVTFRARPFRAEIRTATETIAVRTVQIAVGNGRYYGGGMVVHEHAAIDDGMLDLYSVEVDRWWKVFLLTPAIMRGALEETSWVRTLRGESFEITTHRPRPVNTDGELATATPVKFRIWPRAIRVIVPTKPKAI